MLDIRIWWNRELWLLVMLVGGVRYDSTVMSTRPCTIWSLRFVGCHSHGLLSSPVAVIWQKSCCPLLDHRNLLALLCSYFLVLLSRFLNYCISSLELDFVLANSARLVVNNLRKKLTTYNDIAICSIKVQLELQCLLAKQLITFNIFVQCNQLHYNYIWNFDIFSVLLVT